MPQCRGRGHRRNRRHSIHRERDALLISRTIRNWRLESYSKAIHAVDVGSGKAFTILINSLSNLVDHIKYIHQQYWKAGHTLQQVVMDAQFVTEAVSKCLDANQIELQQPLPYDHGQNGDGESIVKIL